MLGSWFRTPAGLHVSRLAALAVLATVAGFSALNVTSGPAAADVDERTCAVTGIAASSEADARAVRQKLADQPIQELDGVRLDNQHRWDLPDGTHPILVVDSTKPLQQGSGSVVLFGFSFPIASGNGKPVDRYVSTTTMPLLGRTVRTVGVRLHSNACSGELVLSVQRPVWKTTVGLAGIIATLVFGALGILLARRRGGRWWSRALIAAPFGFLAGAGEAVILHEAGTLSPFSHAPIALAAAGVVIVAVLAARPTRLSARLTTIVTVLALLLPVAVVGVTVLASGGAPSSATTEVVTPVFARAVADRAFKQAKAGEVAHADDKSERVLKDYLGAGAPRSVEVGVPRGQLAYPAFFAVTAESTLDGKPHYFLGRFERSAAGKPWTLTWGSQYTKQAMPAPALDGAGYLIQPDSYAVDPATLSRTYTDWLARSRKAGKIVADPVLTDRSGNKFADFIASDSIIDPSTRSLISSTYKFTPGAVVGAPVPLSDGTAHVVFTANADITVHNRRDGKTSNCNDFQSLRAPGLSSPKGYRQISHNFLVQVEAWVPKAGGPAKVLIEDWNFGVAQEKGVTC